MSAGIDFFGPEASDYPVILSVPHAGRHYPDDLGKTCRFTPDRLRPLEDRHADLLADDCWAAGMTPVQGPDLVGPDGATRALGHRIAASLGGTYALVAFA